MSKVTGKNLEGQQAEGQRRGNWFVRFFELDKHIAEDWVRCRNKELDPYVLASLRFIFFVNTLCAVLESFIRACTSSGKNVAKFFFKLTSISAMSLTCYFALMTFLNIRHARDRTHWGPFRRFVLNSLHFSCWMFQIIIPPIYWFALKGYNIPHPHFVSWWQDFSVHGLGIVFLIIELAMVKKWYACWRDGIVSTSMILSYMFYMWLAPLLIEDTAKDGTKRGWWPYNIYRFDYELAPVFYIATLILCIVVSLIVVAIHKWKNK